MADYPDDIPVIKDDFEGRDLPAGKLGDKVPASWLNQVARNLVAVCTELGTLVKGVFANLRARVENIESTKLDNPTTDKLRFDAVAPGTQYGRIGYDADEGRIQIEVEDSGLGVVAHTGNDHSLRVGPNPHQLQITKSSDAGVGNPCNITTSDSADIQFDIRVAMAGDVLFLTNDRGPVIKSPDDTNWIIKVDNAGNLSAVPW